MPEPLKILISIIGDPQHYRCAMYHYSDAENKEVRRMGKFSSSILFDVERPDKSILIGQYTLAKRGSNFEDLCKETVKALCEGVDDVGRFTDVIIAPGVAHVIDKSSRKEFNYRGDIFNFYAYVLYRLARFFEGLSGDVEVVLDLTHGINYMGYLTLRAVNLVLDVYSMVNNVTLKIVNSDPYPQGWGDQSPPPELNINVVLEEAITPTLNYPASSRTELLHPYSGSDEEKARLGKELRASLSEDMRECVRNQEYFINAINRGALLAAYTFADDFGKCVDWAVNYFTRNIETNNEPQQPFTVTPKYSFTETFESLVIAEMIRKVAGIDRKSEVGLEELDSKAEIYRKNTTIYAIIKSETKNLRDMIEEVIGREPGVAESWTKLTYYADKVQRQYSKDPDERTFYAHAGMPYALIEVEGKTKKLRYSNDAIEKVKNLLG